MVYWSHCRVILISIVVTDAKFFVVVVLPDNNQGNDLLDLIFSVCQTDGLNSSQLTAEGRDFTPFE